MREWNARARQAEEARASCRSRSGVARDRDQQIRAEIEAQITADREHELEITQAIRAIAEEWLRSKS